MITLPISDSTIVYKPRHYPIIAKWYTERGLPAPKMSTLSDTGFILDNRVAGWLYMTNSKLAMIEGIISNPQSIPSLRKTSLLRLCALLVDTALALGYTDIIGISEHPSVLEVGKKLGFKAKAYTLLSLKEE